MTPTRPPLDLHPALARALAPMPARRVPKRARPLCGAKCRTRGGEPCNRRVACDPGGRLRARCRLHGGASTGPKTDEGKARSAAAVRARWQRVWAERGEIPAASAPARPADDRLRAPRGRALETHRR
jgi:hypothetical protein